MRQFEIRLAQKHAQNRLHTAKLRSTIENQNRFALIHPKEQGLILQQLELMEQLDEVLTKRMQMHNIPI